MAEPMFQSGDKPQDYLNRIVEASRNNPERLSALQQMREAYGPTSQEQNDAEYWGSVAKGFGTAAPTFWQSIANAGAGAAATTGAQFDRNAIRQQKLSESMLKDAEKFDPMQLAKLSSQVATKGGVITRQQKDGTIVIVDRMTGNEVRRYDPNESSTYTDLLKKFLEQSKDLDTTDPTERNAWATNRAMEALTAARGAAGNRSVAPGSPNAVVSPSNPAGGTVGTSPESAAASMESPQAAMAQLAKLLDIRENGSVGSRDRDMANANIQKLRADFKSRFKLDPFTDDTTPLMGGVAINAADQQATAPPALKTVQGPAGGLQFRDPAVQEGKKTSSAEGAKMYAKLFEENVLVPAQAMQDTGKIMEEFNRLGDMQVALKNGKLKEFMAGEGGKWALSFLPENSDLRRGIGNAQEAEKLTAGMINKILMAAKGVQTEGDAQRARSQVTAIGMDPEANKYLEAYVKETARQLKAREMVGREFRNKSGTWEGYDDAWQATPLMREAKGSVKKFGGTWVGLTDYIEKFKGKNPGATDSDAISRWNGVK